MAPKPAAKHHHGERHDKDGHQPVRSRMGPDLPKRGCEEKQDRGHRTVDGAENRRGYPDPVRIRTPEPERYTRRFGKYCGWIHVWWVGQANPWINAPIQAMTRLKLAAQAIWRPQSFRANFHRISRAIV